MIGNLLLLACTAFLGCACAYPLTNELQPLNSVNTSEKVTNNQEIRYYSNSSFGYPNYYVFTPSLSMDESTWLLCFDSTDNSFNYLEVTDNSYSSLVNMLNLNHSTCGFVFTMDTVNQDVPWVQFMPICYSDLCLYSGNELFYYYPLSYDIYFDFTPSGDNEREINYNYNSWYDDYVYFNNQSIIKLAHDTLYSKYNGHLRFLDPTVSTYYSNTNQKILIGGHDTFSFTYSVGSPITLSLRYFDYVGDNTSFQIGYQTGLTDGYDNGYNDGLSFGYDDGFSDGSIDGYRNGYADGLALAETATFNNFFGSIADTPIIFLRSLFNFDLFGMNMFIIIMSLLTGLVVIYVVKKVIK